MTTVPPTILRPGGTTQEMIESIIGPVNSETKSPGEQAPRSPGMKYLHYAPEAPLYVINYDADKIREAIDNLHTEGKKVAVIGPDELGISGADWYFAIGSAGNNEAMATNLYGALRKCDLTEADLILAVETDLAGVGAAVMNRLMKAAEGKHYMRLKLNTNDLPEHRIRLTDADIRGGFTLTEVIRGRHYDLGRFSDLFFPA